MFVLNVWSVPVRRCASCQKLVCTRLCIAIGPYTYPQIERGSQGTVLRTVLSLRGTLLCDAATRPFRLALFPLLSSPQGAWREELAAVSC